MMRIDWTPWVFALIVILAMGLFFTFYPRPAHGHEAVTGWHYPAHCCSGDDCGHAIKAIRNPDGSLTVTTKHGTATFPRSFEHLPSPDGLIHACFRSSTLYCLYLTTGS